MSTAAAFRLRLTCGVLLCALAAFGADWNTLKPQGYVSDFAGVVDPASRAELDRYCAQVKAATGVEIALVTLPGLDGEPIEDVANTIYRQWGVGSKETDEGILLLLAVGDRKSRLEVGYGLEPYIPDGYAGSLLREMRPALRDQHYGDAMALAASSIGQRVSEAKGIAIDASAPVPQRQRQPERMNWFTLLGPIALLWFLLGAGGRRSRGGMGGYMAAMLLGNLMGRSGRMGGYRGGGGFGGYDSGDSFGGFGGGDSGGGGASGGW